jgi:hypothetical protein
MDHEEQIRRARGARLAFPEGSYAKENRDAITAREIRIAAGLRAVERACTAPDHDIAPAPELGHASFASDDRTADSSRRGVFPQVWKLIT